MHEIMDKGFIWVQNLVLYLIRSGLQFLSCYRWIPTFSVPLERGHEGRHRAARATEYGSAARCGAWLHGLEIDA
jgi:hypothetical protein